MPFFTEKKPNSKSKAEELIKVFNELPDNQHMMLYDEIVVDITSTHHYDVLIETSDDYHKFDLTDSDERNEFKNILNDIELYERKARSFK